MTDPISIVAAAAIADAAAAASAAETAEASDSPRPGERDETVIDEPERASPNIIPNPERSIPRNAASNQAIQISGPIETDMWEEIKSLVEEDGIADDQDLLVRLTTDPGKIISYQNWTRQMKIRKGKNQKIESTPALQTQNSPSEDDVSTHTLPSRIRVTLSKDGWSIRQPIGETGTPSHRTQELNVPEGNQHTSEIHPDAFTRTSTFESHDTRATGEHSKTKLNIDGNGSFPLPSFDESMKSHNPRTVLDENATEDPNTGKGKHRKEEEDTFEFESMALRITNAPTAATSSFNTIYCTYCSKPFTGKYARGNLNRHRRTFHDPNIAKFYKCEYENCIKTFGRADARLKHYMTTHAKIDASQTSLRDQAHVGASGPSGLSRNTTPDTRRDLPEHTIAENLLNTTPQESQEIEEMQRGKTKDPETDKHLASLDSQDDFTPAVDFPNTALPISLVSEGFQKHATSSHEMDEFFDFSQLPEPLPASPSYASSVASVFSFGSAASSTLTSASPSYASSVTSVFSAGSMASSATNLSRSSGYSAMQIASATKVLLTILQDDDLLLPLYKNAMENPYVGPERLRRNLRRIFKAYAKRLEAEATERLEFLTSRLVWIQSGLLATSIVGKLQTAQVTQSVPNDEHKDESSDEDDDDADSSACPVNEEAFEDLNVFREFLVKSDAFQNLRTQVQAFVMGKSTQTTDTSTTESGKQPTNDLLKQCPAMSTTQARRSLSWANWVEDVAQTIDGLLRDTSITNSVKAMMFLVTDAFMLTTDGIFIALGQLEPTLKPGMTRLRWQCGCGDRFYSDVLELREGGISKLTGHMERTSGIKVHASFYNQQSSGQRYIAPRPIKRIQNAVRKIWAALGRATQQSTWLPQYNTQCRANAATTPNSNTPSTSNNNASPTSNSNAPFAANSNTSSTSNNNASQRRILHVLACMHRDRVRICLDQDRIEDVTTDRDLICFLRKQYTRRRGNILRLISLKSLEGLFFVRFRLTKGGEVLMYPHKQCCVAASSVMACGCIPPVPKVEPSPGAEYVCTPGPPDTYPPIPPDWLSNLITCRANMIQDIVKDDTYILDQLPKRTCGKLQGQIGKPAEGWGVYYQESWDRDMITWAIFLLLIVASLLFGILWTKFEMDIQGAFGVSSWITGVCGIFLVVMANHADKKG